MKTVSEIILKIIIFSFLFEGCTIEQNKLEKLRISNESFVPIFSKNTKINTHSGNWHLIYFIEDGECSMCLGELKVWYDVLTKYSSKNNIDVSYIFKKCNKKLLINNLKLLNIEKDIFWDYNRFIERQIDSLSLGNVIVIKENGNIAFSCISNQEKSKDIIGIINRIKRLSK